MERKDIIWACDNCSLLVRFDNKTEADLLRKLTAKVEELEEGLTSLLQGKSIQSMIEQVIKNVMKESFEEKMTWLEESHTSVRKQIEVSQETVASNLQQIDCKQQEAIKQIEEVKKGAWGTTDQEEMPFREILKDVLENKQSLMTFLNGSTSGCS